ncbi:MAG: abortive infection family protein [Rhodospirillales bacterium]|nr:abortive infection family protein [Rhodospirillales bacterium]
MSKPVFSDNFQPYIDTLIELLEAQGEHKSADIVSSATFSISETDYDNWNGGTTTWTLRLSIPPRSYSDLLNEIENYTDILSKTFEPVWTQISEDWLKISISPRIALVKKNQTSNGEIPETVRLNILDGMRIDNVKWFGESDDIEFLSRIYDLDQLPSFDTRFHTAREDISQHRFNNDDWENDWIYEDRRFQLLSGPTDTFLKFLCQIVDPLTRQDSEIVRKLVQNFNDQLIQCGWTLVEDERVAGRPRYKARQEGFKTTTHITRAKQAANTLNATWMIREVQRIEAAIESDPALAIGEAKALLESCCKTILDNEGVEITKKMTLPQMAKEVCKLLKLIPDDIPKEAKGSDSIKMLLSNLGSIPRYVSEIRGLYGSGHGKPGNYRGLEPRHARLAVQSAVTFIDFVTETYKKKKLKDK